MDRASRHARAVGKATSPVSGGEKSGVLPDKYPGGAFFSRDKEAAQGCARQDGCDEPRPFWLRLGNVFDDEAPLTAGTLARVLNAARKDNYNPNFAEGVADMIAPGKGVDWLIRFGREQPEFIVADSGRQLRRLNWEATHPACCNVLVTPVRIAG